MKRGLTVICVVMAAVFFFAGCGEKKQELYLYNWSDYINLDLVQQFEKENNCRVVMDFYDSNETMFAKLKAGASGYDIVVPSGYMVMIMMREGLIESLDHALIPNLKNIDHAFDRFYVDPEQEYAVPYMISTTGIGYLKSKVHDGFVPSWKVFGDSRYTGRMTMLNDMREAIGAALSSLGYSKNTVDPRELEEAKNLLISWKRNLAKFEADQYKNGLVSGEFHVAQGYSGDIYQSIEENEDIVYALPVDGPTIACDSMLILKGSKNRELAHKFINFLLDGEVAAKNMEYIYFLAPNTEAYPHLGEELRNEAPIMLAGEAAESAEALYDLGDMNSLYIQVWDEVKSAR